MSPYAEGWSPALRMAGRAGPTQGPTSPSAWDHTRGAACPREVPLPTRERAASGPPHTGDRGSATAFLKFFPAEETPRSPPPFPAHCLRTQLHALPRTILEATPLTPGEVGEEQP